MLLLLACVHPPAPPPLAPAGEPELAEACRGGDQQRCAEWIVRLELGDFGPGRTAEALTIARSDPSYAQIAALIATAHPELGSAVDDWVNVCRNEMLWACEVAGEQVLATDPARAEAMWKEGCTLGATWLCDRTRASTRPADGLTDAQRADLARLGLTYVMPFGFHPIPVAPSPDFTTDFAILSDDGRLEIRYATRDLTAIADWMKTCRQDPTCTTVDLDTVSEGQPALALANIGTVGPDAVEVRQFPAAAVRLEFNAQWGAFGGVRSRDSWDEPNATTVLQFLHRGLVETYTFSIFHDLSAEKDLFPAAFHALRFTAPVGLQ